MSDKLSISKAVASLPATLDPNTIYLVRTGTGFSMYVSDSTGQFAHSLNSSGPAAVDVREYTTPGTYTWTKPAGAKMVHVELVGAGGGGCSGVSASTNVARYSGGGGGPGATCKAWAQADLLTANVTVTIGAGGAGGSPSTTTTGGQGVNGGATLFGAFTAVGGYAASAPTTTSGAAIGVTQTGPDYIYYYTTATKSGTVGSISTGSMVTSDIRSGAQPGASGGGAAANSTTTSAGGSVYVGGVSAITGLQTYYNISGGSGGGAAGKGANGAVISLLSIGSGGAGGGYSTGMVGGAGGAGARGSGGGGGGAADAGFASGAGGKGGDGFARITTYF